MILQELFRAKEFALAKYSQKRKKLKILITKIFYSLIFGILPVIPLMAYSEMKQGILAEGVSLSIVVFAGSLLLVFFFALELLNVFFMGMIEVSLILSNPLFEWLQTLPLSDKKLTRLKLYSVFRNFDLPIIVMIFAFPIVMFIGTFNFVVLLICLGISITHVILSFSVLILFGNRMNRILNINKLNSRKAMIVRLVNTFGYLIIFFVSLFFIQWAITSIDTLFRFQMVQRNPAILILILSTIPYPFSSSYFITFMTTIDQLHFHYWISIFCGFGLFLIFTYSVTRKALKDLARLSSTKGNDLDEKLNQIEKDVQIKIKIRKPVFAHFFKDLSITSRNLKVFLSAITPIITSFVFTYTFNSTLLRSQTPLDKDFVYNLYVILAFQPIIGGMLIYNLVNIGVGEEAVLATLPIKSKNQAKAKLLYFTIIQTISVVSPYLIYMFETGFLELLLTIFIILPFSWVVLLSMFEMYVYLFGRKKYRFTLNQVNPENKTMKWAYIYIAEYLFYFFITSVSVILFFRGLEYLIFTFTMFLLFCYFVLYFSFRRMFSSTLSPKKKKEKKISKNTHNKFKEDNYSQIKSNLSSFLVNHPGSSIFLLLSINIFIIGLESIFLNLLKRYVMNLRYIFIWLIILSTFIAFITMNRLIKKDYGNAYIESKNRFTKLKGIKTGIIGACLTILLYFFLVFTFSLTSIKYFDFDLFGILTYCLIAIWFEILFRGIIHPILLAKYNERVSLFLNSCITSLFYFLFFMITILTIGGLRIYPILLNLCFIFMINLILTYIFTKEKKIYPTLIFHLITSFTGVLPFFYFGLYLIFPVVFI